MTKRTRVVLLAATVVVTSVVVTGLFAWAGGVSLFAALGDGPAELSYVPGNARMVSYVDVRQVMNSPFRDRFQQLQRGSQLDPNGIEARTGIRLDSDIDRVVMASTGAAPAPAGTDQALVIARGRFDAVRIEGLMRQQSGQVDEYRGKRVVTIRDDRRDAVLAFAEPGLIIFGTRETVRGALDANAGVAGGIGANAEFMTLVDDVDEGTAWSVAKFDSFAGRPQVPAGILEQLPPINWLAASGRVDSGLHAFVRADARDEQSASNLRDVIQGFLALARMQGAREPAYRGMLDSVSLSSTGSSVSLSFEITPAALDAITAGGAVRRAPPRRQ